MANKFAWMAVVLVATVLSGCTSGSDNGGDGNTTESGGVGVGGTVSGPGGGVGGNATVSGSGTMTNTTTDGPEVNATADVSIEGSQFVPSDVTISVGGTVTWTHNDGSTAHTVTADDGSFDSSPNCSPPLTAIGDCMTAGDTFSATFATAGEYTYHCKVHSSMSGTVRVVEP
jgi:plastocyanin